LPESVDEEAQDASKRVAERRRALASTLSSLQATSAEVREKKSQVKNILAALKTAESEGEEWRSKVIEGTTAASLKDAATALETHTESSRLEEQRLRTRSEDLRRKLAELTSAKESAAAEAAALEGSFGDAPASGEVVGKKKKRSAEVADLLAGNQEAAEATEWFVAMTQLCEALGGAALESISEIPLEDTAAAGASSILVKLKLWGLHFLTLTLNRENNACSEVLCGAELIAHFDGKAGVALEVKDLLALAKGLPPPQDVQLLVREALARLAAWPERTQHLNALRMERRCVVNPSGGGALVTLPCGVVCALRLAPDYPRSAGAVVVESLLGAAEDWQDRDLAKLRNDLAATQWKTVNQLFDVLEARLAQGLDKAV